MPWTFGLVSWDLPVDRVLARTSGGKRIRMTPRTGSNQKPLAVGEELGVGQKTVNSS